MTKIEEIKFIYEDVDLTISQKIYLIKSINEQGPFTSLRKSMHSAEAMRSPLGLYPHHFYRKIRAKFDKCTERCGTYEPNDYGRQECLKMCNFQLKMAKKRLKNKEKNK